MIKKINMNNIYYKYIIPHYKYDIALIKWNPNVITPIHDHSSKGCSVYLLSGKLKEDIFKDNSYPKKIFIDRSDATSNHSEFRKILNEQEIIEKLKSDGYKAIRLADISFNEQVKTFFNAEKIIGLHGAGFANLIFCKPNTEILEIKPSTDGKVIENLANKLNINYKRLSKVPEKYNFNNQLGHISINYQEIQNIFNT